MENSRLWGRGRGHLLAVLGLGLLALRCGSSDGGTPGGGGTSGSSNAGANNAGTSNAGTSNAGANTAGSGTAGSHNNAGTAGQDEVAAGAGGAADAGASGADAGAGGSPTAETLGFVFNKQTLPTSNSAFASDLDGNAKVDNAYGTLVSALQANGFPGQVAADADTAAGHGLQLLALTIADSNLVKSKGSLVELSRAKDKAPPDFSGEGLFKVDGTSPSASLAGSIAAGVLTSAPPAVGSKLPIISLRLQFGVAVDVPLHLFSISAKVAANGLSEGQLSGAILTSDVDALVPPALATTFNQVCAGVGVDTQGCKTVLSTFDTDKNGTVTADEVRASDVIKALLASDVKLFDKNGKFAPDSEAAVKDAFSVGIGFTAVTGAIVP